MIDTPDVSVVLEWENVILAEDDRCFAMLRRLREQVAASPRCFEIIVLFDPVRVDADVVAAHLREHLGAPGAEDGIPLRLEPCEGLHYYELKNHGAETARGEIVVFLDSDVVPEDAWLERLLEPLDREDVEVVAGTTYLSHDSFLDRAFALGWFFPLRDPEDRLLPDGGSFFANNVAFRRETFLRYRFPPMPEGVTRGACSSLAKTLRASGVSIWTRTGARAEHPPPSDAGHVAVRALAHGRDHVLRSRAAGRGLVRTAFGAAVVPAFFGLGAAARVARNHRRVGLSLAAVPAAVLLLSGFYGLRLLGAGATLLAPRWARSRWQI